MNRYVPNTCVDPPHDDKVEALHFQPHQRNSSLGHLAVTASRDGKFKIWLLAEEQVIEGKMCLINVCQYINHYVHRTREFKLLADKLILVNSSRQKICMVLPICWLLWGHTLSRCSIFSGWFPFSCGIFSGDKQHCSISPFRSALADL